MGLCYSTHAHRCARLFCFGVWCLSSFFTQLYIFLYLSLSLSLCLSFLDMDLKEYIMTKTCDDRSDIFSLGQLIYAVYNHGACVFESHRNILNFQLNMEKISRLQPQQLQNVPADLQPLVRSGQSHKTSLFPSIVHSHTLIIAVASIWHAHLHPQVKIMLNTHSSVRPSAEEFARAPYFDALPVLTLRCVWCYEKTCCLLLLLLSFQRMCLLTSSPIILFHVFHVYANYLLQHFSSGFLRLLWRKRT